MLLNIGKIFLLIVVMATFSSCASKRYSSTKQYSSSKGYKKIPYQKMRNSAAVQRATMRSYVVHGKRYYPRKSHMNETFEGIASWYGPDFHAKLTSNGETYNMYAQTAASKTLRMNTMVKVYNKDNGKSTIVRINDRGPFISGRIIDLSNKAAHDIDMVQKGTANVHLTVVGFNGEINNNNERKSNIEYNSNATFYLQIGVFSRIEGAKKVKREYNSLRQDNYKAYIKEEKSDYRIMNKVLVGKFRTYEHADSYKNNNQIQNAIVVKY